MRNSVCSAASAVAVVGLVYAARLMKQVYAADTGTPAMQKVAQAVREGANAYLRRQFTVVGVLIVLLTVVIVLSKWPWHLEPGMHTADELRTIAFGRGVAFLMGALFSAGVGFTGMRLATAGNLRVAAAARTNFGTAMRLAYRTGTITGMFTCGLGLLGGALILLVFGELAYEILIGYGFGGSLLALFMRVGGGIYTKAADVGADLVGKVEQSMAEDARPAERGHHRRQCRGQRRRLRRHGGRRFRELHGHDGGEAVMLRATRRQFKATRA